MSVIDKKPYINEILEECSSAELTRLLELVNGDTNSPVFRSLVSYSSAVLTDADKGIKEVKLEISKSLSQNVYNGYLIYNDSVCVLLSYANKCDSAVSIIELTKTNGIWSYKFKHQISVLELRSELNDLLGGGGGFIPDYATIAEIDALFGEPVEYADFTVSSLTNCHLSGIADGDQIVVGQPLTFTVTGTENNLVGGSISNNGVEYTTQEMGSMITDQGDNWFQFTIPVVNGDIVVSFEFQGDEEPEEDVPIESIRYTDGQGQTCLGFGMTEGEHVDLWTNLEILPADYTDGVEFISDDDGIVQVDSGGIATATGVAGESTTITISAMEDPTIYTTVEISINEPDEGEE